MLQSFFGRGREVHAGGPGAERTVLQSGITVITDHVPHVHSVAVGVWIAFGSRDEKASEQGMAHFIEHAVFKGTHSRNAWQIAASIETVGGYLNAFTSKDSTCFYARVPAPHTGRAVAILADLALRPRFAPADVEKEKGVIIDELRSVEDDPEDDIHDHLEAALFGSHPLGHPIIGTERSIVGFTAEALHECLRTQYVAPRMFVTASGAIRHDELIRLCGEAFADAAPGRPRTRRPPALRPPSHIRLERPGQQAHLVFGSRVAGLRERDADALALLNLILGENMSSRLFQHVRERHGCSYNIYSTLSLFEDCGVLSVYLASDTARLERCRSRVERELQDLGGTLVSQRELNRARTQAIGGILMGLESMSTRMNRLGRDEISLGRIMPLEELVDSISSVTRDDILRVAAVACDPARMSSVEFLPSDDATGG